MPYTVFRAPISNPSSVTRATVADGVAFSTITGGSGRVGIIVNNAAASQNRIIRLYNILEAIVRYWKSYRSTTVAAANFLLSSRLGASAPDNVKYPNVTHSNVAHTVNVSAHLAAGHILAFASEGVLMNRFNAIRGLWYCWKAFKNQRYLVG